MGEISRWKNCFGMKLKELSKTKRCRLWKKKVTSFISILVLFLLVFTAEFQIYGPSQHAMIFSEKRLPSHPSIHPSIIFVQKWFHVLSRTRFSTMKRFTTFCLKGVSRGDKQFPTVKESVKAIPRCYTSKILRSAQFSGPKRQPKQRRREKGCDGSFKLRCLFGRNAFFSSPNSCSL